MHLSPGAPNGELGIEEVPFVALRCRWQAPDPASLPATSSRRSRASTCVLRHMAYVA